MDSPAIRQRLLDHIADEHFKLAYIAKEMGVSYNTMSSFIRDNRDTSLRTLIRIQKYLDDFEINKHR